jgi:tRNA dimethylallyltransferase
MLDLRDPWQPYSAAEFGADARVAIDDIVARGKLPILAGGTGLYFRALIEGLAPMPEADPTIRAEIAAEAATRGWAALHAELAAIDPEAGLRIHATDAQRIQRALEVYRVSGQPISHWQRMRGQDRLPLRVLKLAVSPHDRSVLHARIERRFDTMLAAGFLDEVRGLRGLPQLQSHPAPLGLPALRAVGYRQAWEHLDGKTSAAEFRDRAIFATRQLAKRQLTWLRGELDTRWFDPATDSLKLDQAMGLFLGNALR